MQRKGSCYFPLCTLIALHVYMHVTCMFYLMIDIGSLYAYIYMVWLLWSSGHLFLLRHWDMLTSHCFLFTWHQGVWLYPNEHLNEVLGTFFLLQKGRQRGLTCKRHFHYLCSLPPVPQRADNLVNSNREIPGGRKKSATIIWHPILIYCAHIITVPARKKKTGVSSWAGFVLSYLFQQEFYRASNIAEILKVKQTGGLLLKKTKSFIGT